MSSIKLLYHKTPRVLLFFKEKTDIPKNLNPVSYYEPDETLNTKESYYIYELDFPFEDQDLIENSVSIRYHPSNSILLIPKIKNYDIRRSNLNNLVLICNEIFTHHYKDDFLKNFLYFIIQDERVMIVVAEEFAKKLYTHDYMVFFSMHESYRFFLRYFISECVNDHCSVQYHTTHSPDMAIISPKCLQYRKTDFNKIKEGTTKLTSDVMKTLTPHTLNFTRTSFDCIEIVNKTASRTKEVIYYQEKPSITSAENNLSEIISSTNHELSVSSICIEFKNKIESLLDIQYPHIETYSNISKNMMLNISHPKEMYTKYTDQILSITITNIVNFYWLQQSKIFFMIKTSDIVLTVNIPPSMNVNIKCENDVTTFTFDESNLDILFVNSAIHSIDDNCLFLKGVEKIV